MADWSPMTADARIRAHQVPADQLIRFGISFGHDLPMPSEAAAESTGIDVKSARFETVCRYVAQSDACTIVNAIAAEQFKRVDLVAPDPRPLLCRPV